MRIEVCSKSGFGELRSQKRGHRSGALSWGAAVVYDKLLAIISVTSHMRAEKPISLSYHATTLAKRF